MTNELIKLSNYINSYINCVIWTFVLDRPLGEISEVRVSHVCWAMLGSKGRWLEILVDLQGPVILKILKITRKCRIKMINNKALKNKMNKIKNNLKNKKKKMMKC